jgi:hypothetical protein
MIRVFNILSRTFCLLLMIHLLAVSVCDDYLLKLINKSSVEQTIDIEEDTDSDSEDKTFEFDDFDDEYLINSFNSFFHNHSFHIQESLSKVSFQYLQIALSQSNHKILIPPPRF